MSIRTALVLAAGKGTRIRTAEPLRPKPLIEVAGQTVLERNLRQLSAAGVGDVWINLHYEADQIRAVVGNGHEYGLHVQYSWEPVLLGTAGAARNLASALCSAPFVVVYGDNLVALDYGALFEQHRQSGVIGTIAVFDQGLVPNTGLAGGRVLLDTDGTIREFQEGGVTGPYVNAGVYVLEPEIMVWLGDQVPLDFGRDVFPELLRSGQKLVAYRIGGGGYCLGIDTPEGLERAAAFMRS